MGDQLVSIESAKKTGYWHEVINNPPDSVMRAAYTAYHKAAAREATMETKDVWGGMPGLRPKVQHDPPVQRAKRSKARRRAVMLVSGTPMTVQVKVDHIRTVAGMRKYGGKIGDPIIADPIVPGIRVGTPVLGDLLYAGRSVYGKKFAMVTDTNGNVYHVGQHPDGSFVAIDDNEHYVVESAGDRQHALELLNKKIQKRMPMVRTPMKTPTPAKKKTVKKPAAKPAAKPRRPLAKKPAATKPTAKTTAKRITAKKTTTAKKTPAAGRAKRITKSRGPSISSILAQSGANRTPDEKRGVEHVVPLDTTAPTTKGLHIPVRKSTPRNSPSLYQFDKHHNPIQTEQMRIDAHLAAGRPQSSIDKAHREGKEFRFAPREENEHLWFPKDPNGEVIYSFRPGLQKVDANGDPVFKMDPKTKKMVPVYDTYGQRAYVLKPDVQEAKTELKEMQVRAMPTVMYKLDRALKKDYPKTTHRGNVAGAVLLMRVLGVRPNSQSEEQQEASKATRSAVVAARRAKAGNAGYIYGATSIQARHVKISGNEAVLEFVGKDHLVNTHVTTDPDVVAMLKAHLKGKKGEDPLFPDVTSSDTAEYIKEHLGEGANNQRLRNFVATSIAGELIKSRPKPTDWDSYKVAQAEVCRDVSMTLNNKGKQAFDSYIASFVWETWEKGLTKP
jgi:DNA topoisomerase IB